MSRLWDNFHNSRNEMLMAQSTRWNRVYETRYSKKIRHHWKKRKYFVESTFSISHCSRVYSREDCPGDAKNCRTQCDAEHCNECTGSKIASQDLEI